MNFKLPQILLLLAISLVASCTKDSYSEPIINLDNYVLENGFKLSAIASEPFIEAPVTMDFDNKGRMWVVEMKGYMQNIEGINQEMPNGTISILEDRDGDGVADHSKIFLEDLVLPRALAHVYNGLLYAEPPNLWFVEIENDKPKNKVLVDSLYAYGGNVEHQPNGLMMHLDNWIYNAKSNFRYQRKNGEWIKEPTSFRGQWGITKDDFGRLYYNNNSTQLIGDYVLPNTVINNKFYNPKASVNNVLTKNQRVYPLHATSVNRGYIPGVLDEEDKLVNVTSACGPLIYRGGTFPESHYQNAFVCAPEANLVKRNILTFSADSVYATQAWKNKEFLASTDEGFRPVNLFNGPDGNLYIVDMHRGIIQDKAYLSPYLSEQLSIKKLDTIIGMGRILKVSPENSEQKLIPKFETLNSRELVQLLESDNGWIRDRAQQILIFKNEDNSDELLKELIRNSENPLAKIHALHTLSGLNALNFEILKTILYKNTSAELSAHCLILLEQFASKNGTTEFKNLATKLIQKNNAQIDLYFALSMKNWLNATPDSIFPMLVNISNKYQDKKVYQEAIIANLQNFETDFQSFVNQNSLEISPILTHLLTQVKENKNNKRTNSIYSGKNTTTDSRTAGYNLYKSICAACHGMGGNGITGVAPPLMNSDYISGSVDRLTSIILHGLEGPIHINGERFEFNGTMPGLKNNEEISNKDIVSIISYLHNAFTTEGKSTNIKRVEELRKQSPRKGALYTESELLELEK